MRDRSGFDAHGHGDRAHTAALDPGLPLDYPDEFHGYGNVGADDPPARPRWTHGRSRVNETPNLDDAAFKAGDAYSDAGAGHTDNYLGATATGSSTRLPVVHGRRDGRPEVGPEVFGAYNLNADVTLNMTGKCGQFDYGNGAKSAGGVPIGDPVVPPTYQPESRNRTPVSVASTPAAPLKPAGPPR